MSYYAGVDLGATNVRAAVADDDGTIISTARRGTPTGPSGIAVTEAVLDVLRTACEGASIRPTEVAAAGIGSIGPLDLAEGTIEDPANLPDVNDRVPLTGPVGNLIGSDRVYLHNDTAAGVIGQRFYSDRNPDDMIYLTISSGIGAGITVDGNVLSGWDGNVGEVGHLVVDPEGRRTCGCGREGHWEAYCSGNNIPGYARLLHEETGMDTALPIDSEKFAAPDVFEHAGEDDFADHVINRLAEWNAMGVTNIVQAYAPLVVYIGGAVALNNEALVIDPVRERLDETVFNNVPEVQPTTLGDDVVVRGAVASALTAGTGDRASLRR